MESYLAKSRFWFLPSLFIFSSNYFESSKHLIAMKDIIVILLRTKIKFNVMMRKTAICAIAILCYRVFKIVTQCFIGRVFLNFTGFHIEIERRFESFPPSSCWQDDDSLCLPNCYLEESQDKFSHNIKKIPTIQGMASLHSN